MKNFAFAALLALAVLSGCADSSTVGTCIEKEYNIDLIVKENTGVTVVTIPVTVAADSVSATEQETAGEATATPKTDMAVPFSLP